MYVRGAVKFKPEYAHISTRSTVRKMLHNIIIKQHYIFKKFAWKSFFLTRSLNILYCLISPIVALPHPKLQNVVFTILLITFYRSKIACWNFQKCFTTYKTTIWISGIQKFKCLYLIPFIKWYIAEHFTFHPRIICRNVCV